MLNYIIPLSIIGVIFVGYFIYMKFYYPKFKEQYAQYDNEFNKEWTENKSAVLDEYFNDPNRFKLFRDVTQNEEIIGLVSGDLHESFKSKIKEMAVGALTFTKKVDMALYYLVATDKGLHYTGFDGEKCFINEVFDYNHIMEKHLDKGNFSFVYKNEKYRFSIEQASGYPRFNIHEKSKTPTSNDRTTNYFIREFLAYEISENILFKNANSIIPKSNINILKPSKERIKDLKIRQYLEEEFKKKLGLF